MSNLKDAFREAARREFESVPNEEDLDWSFSEAFLLKTQHCFPFLPPQKPIIKKRCFFIGHRDTPSTALMELENAISHCIAQYGISEFVVGQYGNFDRMAATAIKKLKQVDNRISLLLLLPYHPSERPVELPAGFDNSIYPEGLELVSKKLAIIHANRKIIDSCDLIIAYANGPGNARSFVDYAKKRRVPVINLADRLF